MKNSPLRQAESLLGHFKPIDIECAYTIAYALGQQDADILLGDLDVSTTVRQIYAGTAGGMAADRVRVNFYGGPVGHGSWFKGSLYSFLVDCIAVKIQMEGFESTRKLLRIKRLQHQCPPF
jgi:hypothetical protein